MMFLTFGSRVTPRCTACAMIFEFRLTLTFATPGTARAAATRAMRSAAIWVFAG